MKSKVFSLCAVLVLLSVSGFAAERKKRVAVFDFDYSTVRSGVAAIFGTDIDVGKGISALLIKRLVQDGTYSVIEREKMDTILKEQNFSNSDRANPNSAAKIGKLLGVDAIIVGNITQFGNDTKNQGVGGGGGGFGGFGLGGFKHKESKAIVTLDARIVDIDTAEILAVADGKGESPQQHLADGRRRQLARLRRRRRGFRQQRLPEHHHRRGHQAGGRPDEHGVIAGAPKLSARKINVEGVVAFVEMGKVVLNVGSKAGVKVGDQMTISRVSQEIKDPTTGKVIRRLTTEVGKIEISDVDDGSAVGKVVSGQGFKVGDVVKTVTQ